jgi:diguanylate cyclase (GGDEF)-like protein/PAS domain S-box-containing protein
MQSAAFNVAILGIYVFLFASISWMRKDDRLRCWVAAWGSIFIHFSINLWQPTASPWQEIQSCINIDSLALTALLLGLSSFNYAEGRKAFLRIGALVGLATFVCLNLVIAGVTAVWLLNCVVAARLLLTVALAARTRRGRALAGSLEVAVSLAAGAWMVFGIFHAQPEIVIYAILGEVFLVAAVEFWNGWTRRTRALKFVTAGLVAWSSVFPAGFWVSQLWPHLSVYPEFWNIPKFCVAAGMILLVLEEDTHAAKSLTEEYRLLFDSNPNPLWIFEAATLKFLSVNQSALNHLGYSREEFLGLKLTDILHPGIREAVRHEVASSTFASNHASMHLRKDGSYLPMDITAHGINFLGKPSRFTMALDVTERESLRRQLEDQAQHDSLTGLPNRMLFPQLVAEAVRGAVKSNEKLAILSLDIDRFKRINDTYGFRVGDECIQRIAAILCANVRSMDIVARTAGEEFTIVLTGIKGALSAEHMAKTLKDALGQPLLVQGYKIQLSFCVGMAICPDDGTDPIALWRGAESAQRQAKTAGDGNLVWLSPELSRSADEQIQLEAHLRDRLDDGGFHLAYQPIYDFDGVVQGMEALLRLNHPTRGAVSPDKIIPVAEQSGLIAPLGQWVIEKVCQQLTTWKSDGARMVPVAVNVSGLQLMHGEFAGRLTETLGRHGIDPDSIHLEVTESVMGNLAEASAMIDALAALGFVFSIDDFGTGHSSLGRLHLLQFGVLKIDRSFISQLFAENSTLSIVQAIISMAHGLGHRVVAEGVETVEQFACLRDLGCDLLQGYLMSRPVSPDRIPALAAALAPFLVKDEGVPSAPLSLSGIAANPFQIN